MQKTNKNFIIFIIVLLLFFVGSLVFVFTGSTETGDGHQVLPTKSPEGNTASTGEPHRDTTVPASTIAETASALQITVLPTGPRIAPDVNAILSAPSESPTPRPPALPGSNPTCEEAYGYKLKQGDFLSLVAFRKYGRWIDYRAIYHYTNIKSQEPGSPFQLIKDPNLVYIDQCIYLPTKGEITAYWLNIQNVIPIPNTQIANGKISIAGSSTVYPLTEQIAEQFKNAGYKGIIEDKSIGTHAGFRRFCAGEIDIVNASIPIPKEELDACLAKNINPIAFEIAKDALPIMVSRKNSFIKEVTLKELELIFSDKVNNWQQVNPSWPNEPIRRVFPDEQSGTFDFFVEKIFNGDKIPILSAESKTISYKDELLVAEIADDEYAIGFFGYAFYLRNQSTLRILTMNGTIPLQETVDDETYPLTRPLFIYSTAEIIKGKPEVAAFIQFYLRETHNNVGGVGYFAPSERGFDGSINNLKNVIP